MRENLVSRSMCETRVVLAAPIRPPCRLLNFSGSSRRAAAGRIFPVARGPSPSARRPGRTVLRWLSGPAEPRPGVWAALLAVAVKRAADLSAIIAELEQRANGSLSAAPPDAELFFHWCRRHHLPLD